MTESTQASAPWQAFLTQQGAHIEAANGAEVRYFGQAATAELPDNFVAPLTDLGLISLSGDDAASFLHNQITNDVEKLDLATARLAGYCTPKGRLLATFLMWKDAGQIVLQLPRAIQPAIQKRLQMFVMRSKAKLADVSEQYVALGLAGNAAAAALQQWFPQLPAQAYAKIDNENGTLVRVADSRQAPRYQWITSVEQAIAAWPVLTQALSAVGTHAWRLTDIYAGVPVITQATQEQFVPQMINFELIGGVNFKKGCYPGQEIVARSQYLGKLKRRSVLALVDTADARAGAEVFSSEDPGQPCGMVVNAEPAGAGKSACLVEIKLAASDNGTIHLGAADGPVLHLQPLPYELAEPQ
ncbi:folate-binding protein YgfZ [Herbaspirillum sp. CF444]|uniref:CAF17-like 4Fe-4S cluster assembly/insertion protein YgfZ n=1 Tax=Herbaspirillum sp. CF444 TaxID=1144319 RepID=UPI0002723FD5|nr:folate-binding protein YgfZ [Herbaspirillum sp. CF444]EJL92041.1 folate-binding protein YgfZ [Herbaspirillum sp. CF444]